MVLLLQSVIVCDRYVLPIPSYPIWSALEYREELRKLPHSLSSHLAILLPYPFWSRTFCVSPYSYRITYPL
jgi:hypothetical protein